jgi:hypothetical protein
MNLSLILGVLLIAAVPAWAQAQSAATGENAQHETISGDQTQSRPPTAATEDAQGEAIRKAAQEEFEAISDDKAQTKTYCDIVKLKDKIKMAQERGDVQKSTEIARQMSELSRKLDPKAAKLMVVRFSDKNLVAKLGLKLDPTLQAAADKLDGLCESAEPEADGREGSEDRSGNADNR